MRWFPVVGLVIGAVWALCYTLVNRFFGPFVAAAAVLVADALVTGALHLDAVADVADGVASRRPPDEAVQIMREPSVGAVGAAVLVLVCLLRLSLLELVGVGAVTLVAVPVAGRAAMALLLALVPPRQDGSLAAAFHPTGPGSTGPGSTGPGSTGPGSTGPGSTGPGSTGPGSTGPGSTGPGSTVVALAVAVVCVALPAAFTRDPRPLAGLVLAVVGATCYAWWWRARFGSLTGDGAGAGGIFAETLALFVMGIQPTGV